MNRRRNRDQGTKPKLETCLNAPAIGLSGRFGYRFCGLTLRELGAAAQGMSYPAVSKAVARLEQPLHRDRRLRELAKRGKPLYLMSRRDPNALDLERTPYGARTGNIETGKIKAGRGAVRREAMARTTAAHNGTICCHRD